MSGKEIIPRPPTGVTLLPDTDRHVNRFDVRSSSSKRMYRVSYDTAKNMRCWVCSCPGYIRHGHCKHTRGIGLSPTRSSRTQINDQPKRKRLNG